MGGDGEKIKERLGERRRKRERKVKIVGGTEERRDRG